jgi:hypothetical protein
MGLIILRWLSHFEDVVSPKRGKRGQPVHIIQRGGRLVSWGSTCICTPSFESASFINGLSHFLTAAFESFQLVDRADFVAAATPGIPRVSSLPLQQSSETINDGGNGGKEMDYESSEYERGAARTPVDPYANESFPC